MGSGLGHDVHVALEHWSLISLCVGDLLQIRQRELVSDPAGEYNEGRGLWATTCRMAIAWSLISLCVGDLLQIRRELVSDPAGEYNEDEGVGSHGNCVEISDVTAF